MKAILMSINPKWVANILNGIKTLEIRKKFPKDYVGWVYIYVTKDRRYFLDQCAEPNDNSWFCWDYDDGIPFVGTKKNGKSGKLARDEVDSFNGTVIARFWCDKVENIIFSFSGVYTKSINHNELLKLSCLTNEELEKYLPTSNGYAIHIKLNTLKIFDKPKELKEFYHHFTLKRCERRFSNTNIEIDDKTGGLRQPTKHGYEYVYPLTSAPQSWCYIEVYE